MSDHNQAASARLQSSAIVLAAVITTTGVVTAACIQAGWIKTQPIAAKFAALADQEPSSPPRLQAMFTGSIEPLDEPQVATAHLVSPTTPAREQTVRKPITPPPAPSYGKPLIGTGSWFSFLNPSPGETHPAPQTQTAKSVDWGTIPRMFQGRN